MSLYIIAGHGAGDPGATSGGYKEANLVRKLAKRIDALGGSKVKVLDTSKNWYKTGGISKLSLKKNDCILELHMDSATSKEARGGHVIIKSGYNADNYDKALAAFIGEFFPGRSKTIVKRSDLANCNRAAVKGYNYRLLEVCFISNANDRKKFINQMDAIAEGILEAFEIPVKKAVAEKKETTDKKETTKKKTNEEIAKEVIAGKWGNGDARKKALKEAGYDPDAIQKIVNKLV